MRRVDVSRAQGEVEEAKARVRRATADLDDARDTVKRCGRTLDAMVLRYGPDPTQYTPEQKDAMAEAKVNVAKAEVNVAETKVDVAKAEGDIQAWVVAKDSLVSALLACKRLFDEGPLKNEEMSAAVKKQIEDTKLLKFDSIGICFFCFFCIFKFL